MLKVHLNLSKKIRSMKTILSRSSYSCLFACALALSTRPIPTRPPMPGTALREWKRPGGPGFRGEYLGTNHWLTLESWPPAVEEMYFYLQPDGKLAFTPPGEVEGFTDYSSDPASPVPYRPRPIRNFDYSNEPAIKARQR